MALDVLDCFSMHSSCYFPVKDYTEILKLVYKEDVLSVQRKMRLTSVCPREKCSPRRLCLFTHIFQHPHHDASNVGYINALCFGGDLF
jgi:hypothetical protein